MHAPCYPCWLSLRVRPAVEVVERVLLVLVYGDRLPRYGLDENLFGLVSGIADCSATMRTWFVLIQPHDVPENVW